jgi:chromate transport protein ChrA
VSWFHSLGGALLLGLAVWLRPNMFPPAAVIVLGAIVMSVRVRDLPGAIALCVGFSVVGLMALHNWVFGQAFVPFGSNAAIPEVLVVPPHIYAQALAEFARADLHGEGLIRVIKQLHIALLGPTQTHAFVFICAAEIAIVIRVAFRRQSSHWDRLLAVAALAGFSIMLFYANTPRYHLLTWLLAAIVSAMWLNDEALPWLWRTRLLQRWDKHLLVIEALKQWHWIERKALAR